MAASANGFETVEASPVVLQPLCSVQTISLGNSFGDSDSDDDLDMNSSEAAYKSAHGHLLPMNDKKVTFNIE